MSKKKRRRNSGRGELQAMALAWLKLAYREAETKRATLIDALQMCRDFDLQWDDIGEALEMSKPMANKRFAQFVHPPDQEMVHRVRRLRGLTASETTDGEPTSPRRHKHY